MMIDPLATPEKIAFAGDWHANATHAEAAIEYAADWRADVLLHVGDFGYTFTRRYLDVVTQAGRDTGIPVLFVDGNHEDHRWLLRQPIGPNGLRQLTPMIWHIPRGFRWEWDGVRFLGLGGAHSVDGIWRREAGELWCREERITLQQADEVAAAGETDVLISHDCPAGVDIPDLDREEHLFPPIEIMRAGEHRQILRGVVDRVRPAMMWHGHYHRRYTAKAYMGWGGLVVQGLHCDGFDFDKNVHVEELDMIAAAVAAVRAGL